MEANKVGEVHSVTGHLKSILHRKIEHQIIDVDLSSDEL